jgi:putative MATE family efflux protein
MINDVNRKGILQLSWPLMLASASDIIMTSTDAAFLGHVGTAELAAVGLSGLFIWASYNLFKGIPLCVSTFVSQNFGAKRFPNCIVSLYNGLLLVVLSSVLLYLYRFAVPQLVALMGSSVRVQELSTVYAQIRMLGAIWFLSSIAFASFYRGIGNTRIVLYSNIVANLLNVVLDYLMIFGALGFPKWGIKGAAVATVLSQFAGTLFYAISFLAMKRREFNTGDKHLRIDVAELKKLVDIGTPRSLALFAEVFGVFAFTMFVGRLGDTQLAANTIMIQLIIFSNITAFGFGHGGSAIVGQFIGAGNKPSAKKSGYYSMEMNVLFTAAFCAVMFLIPEYLCMIFNSNPDVIVFFRQIVFFGAIFVCFDGLQIVASSCLSAAGDTKALFYGQLLLAYGIYIPLSYIFTFPLGLGIRGAWLGASVYIISLGCFLAFRFMGGYWEKIVLIPVAGAVKNGTE